MPIDRIFASLIIVTMVVCLCALPPRAAQAESTGAPQRPGVAVLDFNYVDTSGETNSKTAEHQQWLGALAAGLRADFASSGAYRLVAPACRPAPCEVGRSSLDELQRAAKEAGAKLLIMGAVHKQSTLVQWAKVVGVNLDTDAVAFDKLFSFRGDNAEAWRQVEQFMARDLLMAAFPVAAVGNQSASGIRLAVFDFELLDVSAGASVVAESAVDVEQLQRATDEARHLIAQSGRYALIDAGTTDAPAAKTHAPRDCDGCKAAIAAKLGAEQSLLGIVTRISRTDYNVTYKLRDASTGALIAVEQTDMRAGANDSWPRGAASLIKNKLLAK
jgi:Protein of unknown function (DUF2380)